MGYKVVFMRHGTSVWNKENRFTGWTDVDLTEEGIAEAKAGAEMIKEANLQFDIAYTSVLTRAIDTCNIVLKETKMQYIPVIKNWRLNERQYGALEGLNKAETAKKHGEAQVKLWRRSYNTPPPALEASDERYPGNKPAYKQVFRKVLPFCESLENCVTRVIPYWVDQIVPSVLCGKRVIVVAHGNSIRALFKYLEDISNEDIIDLNIPTGIPIVYEFDDNMNPIKRYFLADEEAVQKRINDVINQGKAK